MKKAVAPIVRVPSTKLRGFVYKGDAVRVAYCLLYDSRYGAIRSPVAVLLHAAEIMTAACCIQISLRA